MGLNLIKRILDQHQNTTIYHLNRGKDHWNNRIKQLHSLYGDRLRHIKCNRRKRDKFINVRKIHRHFSHSTIKIFLWYEGWQCKNKTLDNL